MNRTVPLKASPSQTASCAVSKKKRNMERSTTVMEARSAESLDKSSSGMTDKRRITKKRTPCHTVMPRTPVLPAVARSPSVPAMTPEANMALLAMVGKALTEFEWYHGLMPRIECEEMLKEDGDFVVRRTTVKRVSVYCISANTKGIVKHIPMDYKKGQWTVLGESSGTLNELIDYLVKEQRPIGATGVILKTGIPRPDFYILHENIQVDKKIGAGAFGEVYTGVLRIKNDLQLKAAIKKIKGQVKKEQVAEFVKEAKVMRRFQHPNTVRLYGVAPQEEPIMIVLELCAGGSLKGFFKNHPDCKDEQCVSFTRDACRGLCYLSVSQVIHRDIAARNCLLGDRNEVKISDFGLSVVDKTELKMTKLKSVPVKWLAPETLKEGVFTTKTDVWSFGVLTWEIFNRCKSDPFPNETNAQAKVKILGDTAPMEPPPTAPPIVKSVMDTCFVKDPAKRGDFVSLLKILAPEEKAPSKAENI